MAVGASTSAPAKDAHTKKPRELKNLFTKDLGPMMYGFGDPGPAPDTVSVMEELVIDYITDVCLSAHRMSSSRRKIKVEDFKFALRKDPKKLARVDELLFMAEDIARARGKADDLAAYAEEEGEGEKGGDGEGQGAAKRQKVAPTDKGKARAA